ncbi:hypothetical protein AB1Y20_023623 [Prymnesium parvum]|uniref:Methyltransferase type 11 domain-containing protein n=1 Tax=Prymnesium parvum TaxID=97485 RepID=A0AB34JGT5_PRYPA
MAAKARAVPSALLGAALPSSAEELPELPEIEREHVQRVYDAIALEWHGTRYKAWPRVASFVGRLPRASLIADLGCGNGKMHAACAAHGHLAIGCDFSAALVRICALQLRMEAQAADVTALPYRAAVFDAALSIAVLHHVSTVGRRRRLVRETLRVLRPGGQALFYAWAKEQAAGRSGHVFPSADVFVPFHQRLTRAEGEEAAAEHKRPREEGAAEGVAAAFDPEKRAVVHQRYCHVYAEGELRELVESVEGFRVLEEYYDTGNWCILAEKAA